MSHHDALDQGMFWAGALMALAPIVFAAIVIGVWWVQRRQQGRGAGGRGRGDT